MKRWKEDGHPDGLREAPDGEYVEHIDHLVMCDFLNAEIQRLRALVFTAYKQGVEDGKEWERDKTGREHPRFDMSGLDKELGQ